MQALKHYTTAAVDSLGGCEGSPTRSQGHSECETQVHTLCALAVLAERAVHAVKQCNQAVGLLRLRTWPWLLPT